MTATCHRRPPDQYPRLLADECESFIEVVYGADADLAVPSCPGWTAADVGVHVGQLYRWAAEHVRTRSAERIPGSSIDMQMPDDRAAQPDWMRAGVELLSAALASTDPDTRLWGWGSDKSARFWGRRMLFETTIHRADVELALGREPAIDAATAIDGVDEFLDNLPYAKYFAPKVKELRGDGETLLMSSNNDRVKWLIRLVADGFTWSHTAEGPSDTAISGSAAKLLLFTYGRLTARDLEVEGDESLVERWAVNSAI